MVTRSTVRVNGTYEIERNLPGRVCSRDDTSLIVQYKDLLTSMITYTVLRDEATQKECAHFQYGLFEFQTFDTEELAQIAADAANAAVNTRPPLPVPVVAAKKRLLPPQADEPPAKLPRLPLKAAAKQRQLYVPSDAEDEDEDEEEEARVKASARARAETKAKAKKAKAKVLPLAQKVPRTRPQYQLAPPQ